MSRTWPVIVASWLALALFASTQLHSLSPRAGISEGEAQALAIGLGALQRSMTLHDYLSSALGLSPWPVLAALAYRWGGLLAVRLLTTACVVIGGGLLVSAARALFGPHAALWAALALVVSGPMLAASGVGNMSQLGLLGGGLAMWTLAQLVRHDHRRWLFAATLVLSLTLVSDMTLLAVAVPALGLVLWLRRKKRGIDLFISAYLVGGMLLAYSLLLHRSAVSLVSDVWAYAPALYLPGVLIALLICAPLLGLALRGLWAWQAGPGHVVVLAMLTALALASIGAGSVASAAHVDATPATGYLVTRAQPGDRIYSPNAWSLAFGLTARGRLASTQDVYDPLRATKGADLCGFTWIVDEQGAADWSPDFESQIRSCYLFTPVSIMTTEATYLGPGLSWSRHTVRIVIWRNSLAPTAEGWP
jgi:hypothetical protein